MDWTNIYFTSNYSKYNKWQIKRFLTKKSYSFIFNNLERNISWNSTNDTRLTHTHAHTIKDEKTKGKGSGEWRSPPKYYNIVREAREIPQCPMAVHAIVVVVVRRSCSTLQCSGVALKKARQLSRLQLGNTHTHTHHTQANHSTQYCCLSINLTVNLVIFMVLFKFFVLFM